MKNSKVLYLELINRISLDESREEISAVAYQIMEKVLSLNKTDILAEKMIDLSQQEEDAISATIKRVNNLEPVQYVLGEAFFFNRKFFVDRTVLIPRPETEELVASVIRKVGSSSAVRIADIGTGSGCIAITLALELEKSAVYATDINTSALTVAKNNTTALRADVEFTMHDILHNAIPFRNLDIVVSNPPYIPYEERTTMRESVFAFEPNSALFVPDEDPLLFYRALATRAFHALVPKGLLAVEINERFGAEVVSLFSSHGYKKVELVKDIFRKDRIVFGHKP